MAHKTNKVTYPKGVKVLFLDIENSKCLAGIFHRYTNIVPASSIYTRSEVLMIGYKWHDEKKPTIITRRTHTKEEMMAQLTQILSEADLVVGHNLDKFDLPKLRTMAIDSGHPPLDIPRSVDTYKEAKSVFRFESNRLDDLGHYLGIGRKTKGISDLRDKIAIEQLKNGGVLEAPGNNTELNAMLLLMEKYCKNDVFPLQQKVYEAIRPYIKSHPNLSLLTKESTKTQCHKCGSMGVIKYGTRVDLS